MVIADGADTLNNGDDRSDRRFDDPRSGTLARDPFNGLSRRRIRPVGPNAIPLTATAATRAAPSVHSNQPLPVVVRFRDLHHSQSGVCLCNHIVVSRCRAGRNRDRKRSHVRRARRERINRSACKQLIARLERVVRRQVVLNNRGSRFAATTIRHVVFHQGGCSRQYRPRGRRYRDDQIRPDANDRIAPLLPSCVSLTRLPPSALANR